MADLEHDLEQERRRIDELRTRAARRLQECAREAEGFQAEATRAGGQGGAEFERRAQKRRALAGRYEDLAQELAGPTDRLAAEVLLARLQGPELDILSGEVDRNRQLVVQGATDLLRARDEHRALRQRWGELSDKIRTLRASRGLPA